MSWLGCLYFLCGVLVVSHGAVIPHYNLTLANYYNQSGHWVMEMRLEHENEQPWVIHISQNEGATVAKLGGLDAPLKISGPRIAEMTTSAPDTTTWGNYPLPTPSSDPLDPEYEDNGDNTDDYDLPEENSALDTSPDTNEKQAILPLDMCTPPIGLGYEFVPGLGYYKYHDTQKTWQEAEATCNDEGTNLLVIENEMDLMNTKLLLARKRSSGRHWVGFNDKSTEGEYITVYNERFDVKARDWYPGEPSGSSSENCGVFYYNPSGGFLGQGDYDCSENLPFVCKQPVTPKGSLVFKMSRLKAANRFPAHEDDSEFLPPEMCVPAGSLGYQLEKGVGYYKYHQSPGSWKEAAATCENEGSHLLVINSQMELMVIKLMLTQESNGNQIWVGFKDTDEGYMTVLNESLESTGYSDWISQQSNYRMNYMCGTFKYDYNDNISGLDSSVCNDNWRFICEKELFL